MFANRFSLELRNPWDSVARADPGASVSVRAAETSKYVRHSSWDFRKRINRVAKRTQNYSNKNTLAGKWKALPHTITSARVGPFMSLASSSSSSSSSSPSPLSSSSSPLSASSTSSSASLVDVSWINHLSPSWHPVDPTWQANESSCLLPSSSSSSSSSANPFLLLPPAWRMLLLSDGSVTRHLTALTASSSSRVGGPVSPASPPSPSSPAPSNGGSSLNGLSMRKEEEPSPSISVRCLEMREIGHSLLGLPPGVALLPGPRVQRQVHLVSAPPSGAGTACSSPAPAEGRNGAAAAAADAEASVSIYDSTSSSSSSSSPSSSPAPLVYATSWWASRELPSLLRSNAHSAVWSALAEQRTELFREVRQLHLGHSPELEAVFGCPGPFWARHYFFHHGGRPLTLIYEVFNHGVLDLYLGDSRASRRSVNSQEEAEGVEEEAEEGPKARSTTEQTTEGRSANKAPAAAAAARSN